MAAAQKATDGLSERVHTFAKTVKTFSLEQASVKLSESVPRIKGAVGAAISTGSVVRVGIGKYRAATAEDHAAAAKPRPPTRPAVQQRLNRLAIVLNTMHEELSELRHDLNVRETVESSYPALMRCASPWDREA